MSENFLRLDSDTARSLAYCLQGEQFDGYEVIENELVDITRWNTLHILVIKEIGTPGFWSTSYQKGATESQSDEPFEYEDTAEFYRVKPEIIQKTKWVMVTE